MNQKLRKILPHVAIVLCNMYIVFFLIDRVNTAMQFINNSITKALLLILCVISTINSSFLIRDERRRQAAQLRRQPARQAIAQGARAVQGTQAVHSAPRQPAAARTSAVAGQSAASRPASGQTGARR